MSAPVARPDVSRLILPINPAKDDDALLTVVVRVEVAESIYELVAKLPPSPSKAEVKVLVAPPQTLTARRLESEI